MSSINMTEVNPNAVPAPANGEVEFLVNTASEPAVKLPSGAVKVLGGTFGTQFSSKKRSTTQTTTGTSFVVYDSMSLTGLPQGNYRIDMRWVWGYSSGSNDIRVRWQLDNNQIIPEHRQEPKDGGSDQRYHECSFEVLTLDGDHIIEVEFASSSGGNQARMYESQMIVYRID